jgi:hypothetical protein
MYYYMILVLDPDFSAEEIRDAKRLRSKNTKGSMHGTSSRAIARKRSRSDEEWDGEVKGKGKGKRIC